MANNDISDNSNVVQSNEVLVTEQTTSKPTTVPIFIMGKRYHVPSTLTILKALEYAGYRLLRGVGCRAGFCGACATVYKTPDSYKLKVGLACQTVVEPEMWVTELPFFPAVKKTYDIEKIPATAEAVMAIYPEIARCVACNSCTRVCPQDLEVMDIIQETLHGNLKKAAELSFDCVMCGLCASRCPAEIVHYNIAILVRRLYNRHLVPNSLELAVRVEELAENKYQNEVDRLKVLDEEQLRKIYSVRPREGSPGVELKTNRIDWDDEIMKGNVK